MGKVEWSNRQKEIIDKAVNGETTIVIEGGPGTGKTIMAIDIAKKESKRGNRVLHLMHNVPLSQYALQRTDLGLVNNVTSTTYHKWIYKVYREIDVRVPLINNVPFNYDWSRIELYLQIYSIGIYYDVVITDETQDFPVELLRILSRLTDKMVCFIDPNQAAEDGKTGLNELLEVFNLKSAEHITQGYRTTKQIMDAARIFKTHKELSQVDNRRGPYPKMVCCKNDSDDRFELQNGKIMDVIRENPGKDIGIIVNPKFMTPLKKVLDIHNIEYTSYKGDSRTDFSDEDRVDGRLDFSKKGVKIVTFRTVKGLDFDIVIIPNVENIDNTGDVVKNHNKMYVAMTRATDELYILYGDTNRHSSKWTDAARVIEDNKVLFDWEYYEK